MLFKLKSLKKEKRLSEEKESVNDKSSSVTPEIEVLLKKTWKEYKFERKIFVLSSFVYGLVLLLLMGLLMARKQVVVLTPPQIKEKLAISYNTASEPYYKEMALFLTQLVGNLSPNTARYAIKVFSSYLDPSIYERTSDALNEVADIIIKNQTATVFYPSKIGRVGNTWYVVGTSYKFAKNQKQQLTTNAGEVITYEIKFKVRNFRLFVVSFKQSNGDTLRKAAIEARKKK